MVEPTSAGWEPGGQEPGGQGTAEGRRQTREQAEFAGVLGRLLADAWADRERLPTGPPER